MKELNSNEVQAVSGGFFLGKIIKFKLGVISSIFCKQKPKCPPVKPDCGGDTGQV